MKTGDGVLRMCGGDISVVQKQPAHCIPVGLLVVGVMVGFSVGFAVGFTVGTAVVCDLLYEATHCVTVDFIALNGSLVDLKVM